MLKLLHHRVILCFMVAVCPFRVYGQEISIAEKLEAIIREDGGFDNQRITDSLISVGNDAAPTMALMITERSLGAFLMLPALSELNPSLADSTLTSMLREMSIEATTERTWPDKYVMMAVVRQRLYKASPYLVTFLMTGKKVTYYMSADNWDKDYSTLRSFERSLWSAAALVVVGSAKEKEIALEYLLSVATENFDLQSRRAREAILVGFVNALNTPELHKDEIVSYIASCIRSSEEIYEDVLRLLPRKTESVELIKAVYFRLSNFDSLFSNDSLGTVFAEMEVLSEIPLATEILPKHFLRERWQRFASSMYANMPALPTQVIGGTGSCRLDAFLNRIGVEVEKSVQF